MTLSFWNSILALMPGLVPYLFVIWVAAAVFAIARLATVANEDRPPARAGLLAIWHGFGAGLWLTTGLIVNEAHTRGLVSRSTLIVTLVVAFVIAAGSTWWLDRRASLRVPQAR
jgi:hypothetical protein